MAERVLVIGAGMAGLWTAMALASTGREVVILDRDPSPPSGDADVAFNDWNRRGVGHLRHSHAFLARLRTLIRDRHPKLLEDLLAAGCRELTFDGSLTEHHKRNFKPRPIDADLAILTSRRTTLELVLRRYAEQQPGITMRPETFVSGLLVTAGTTPRVTGVRLEDGSHLSADIVVDAGGHASSGQDYLSSAGVTLPETSESCGVVYFTRHYRLRPGIAEPPRGKAAGTGDLGYLKFGIFPGDNGCFSITLCLPEVEEEMRKAIVDPGIFDTICRELPGVAPWIATETAEPTSRVFGMGKLESRWRDLAPDEQPRVLGYFPVGDSAVRTNPLYGRGCSFAGVSAYLLRDALETSSDPAQQLLSYRQGLETELRPYYDFMCQADRAAIRRAEQALTPGWRPNFRQRLARSFTEDGLAIAIRQDADLLRAFLTGFHMLEHPQAWLRRPANVVKILRTWARGRKANADLYPAKGGPDREPMLTRLGVSVSADIERLAANRA